MPGSIFQLLKHSLTTMSLVACDLVRLLVLVSRSRRALAAENLFLRKQLALFQERKLKPHRAHDSTRLVMVILARMFCWCGALVNVQPDTLLRSHRKGFPSPLALEITTCWQTAKSPRICADSSERWPQRIRPGRGTHRQRVEAQADHSGLPAHRRQVPS